jgi:hypothetical protein
VAAIHEDGETGAFLGLPVFTLSDLPSEDLDLIIIASFTDNRRDISNLTKQGFPPERILTLTRG